MTMPLIRLPEEDAAIDIPRDSMLLDSCVLISAFFPDDQYHDDAQDFVMREYTFVVPYVVVQEAWGMLVRAKRQRRRYGLSMLRWVAESSNVILLPGWSELLQSSKKSCEDLGIDFVDAFLMGLASRVTDTFRGGGPAVIATYDTRHFFGSQKAFRFECWDLRDGLMGRP